MLASAYQLLGETDKSKSILRDLINVYGDRTNAKYFMECINGGYKFDGGIYLGIPAALALAKVGELDKYTSDPERFEHAFLHLKNIKDTIRWRIMTNSDDDFSYMLITEVGLLRNSASTKFIEELLISDSISFDAKITALYYLLTMRRKKHITLLSENYLRSIIPLDIKDATNVILEAYAMCAVNLAPLLGSYEESLYEAFLLIEKTLTEELSHMRSPEALAALVVCSSEDLNFSEDIKVIAGLFGASLPTLRKYLKYLENK